MRRIKPAAFPGIWNRLDRYIFGEVHPPFLMAMLIYNGIFFINTFTKITSLAGDIQLPFHLFLFLFLSYIPEILYLTLPISFLFASQAAFARMSADSEIIAPLSTGVSFWRMNRPIIAYGLLLTVFSFILTNWLAPNMAKLADHKYRTFIKSHAIPSLTPGVITTMGKSDILYVDQVIDHTLMDLIFISHNGEEEQITTAKDAEFINKGDEGWSLILNQGNIKSFSKNASRAVQTTQYRHLERDFPRKKFGKNSLFAGEGQQLSSLDLYRQTWSKGDFLSERAIDLAKRVWLPFSCLIFSFFAAPLSAKHSRLGSGNSFGISLILIVSYLLFFKTGSEMAYSHTLYPLLAISATPLLYLLIGFILQIGKHRGWGRKTQKLKDAWLNILDGIKKQIFRIPRKFTNRKAQLKKGRRAAYTLRFPTKIDLYVTKFFFKTWLLIQLSVTMLILLVEYTQISPFAKKNHIDSGTVFQYLGFKIPELTDTTIFFCLLISVLVVFAIMSKHQEITAIRAGGGSLQRVCLPLIIFGLLASVNSFYMEDVLMPWSNRNAFRLRHFIKHKEATLFTHDVWMKTGPDHLLNFKYFERDSLTLYNTIAYSLSPETHTLNKRTQYPEIKYSYQHGWINRKNADSWIFQKTNEDEDMRKTVVPRGEPVELGVDLKDLEQKKRDPREFSISQLKEYYQYLHDMGFQSQQYYTEMLAKMAQPFLPFIMMLLAMPMGFQFGRKGSVYSMGIGILTGLSFWALFELFKGMGASGILPPPLAAWGVISVFSVVAIWRFLRMGD